MKRAVRTGLPDRVTSVASARPRVIRISTLRPAVWYYAPSTTPDGRPAVELVAATVGLSRPVRRYRLRVDIDWSAEVVDQVESHWRYRLRPRLDGLTDDEYFWQPVPDC
jgi:hypothetical protein